MINRNMKNINDQLTTLLTCINSSKSLFITKKGQQPYIRDLMGFIVTPLAFMNGIKTIKI